MFSALFNYLIYNPIYNSLVFLIDTLPWADVGVAVILITLVVKLILFPLSKKAARTQVAMRAIEPELKEIKERYKNNREEQAKQTMSLYKKRGVNPFSSIFLIIIQLPVIFALYFVFLRGGLPVINTDILYSFVSVPTKVDMSFLGILDVAERSAGLALLAGISQFIHAYLITPKRTPKKKGQQSLKEDFARSMQLQMKYVMPVIVAFIAYGLSAIISLYWITSNVFTIGQEFFVRRSAEKELPAKKPED